MHIILYSLKKRKLIPKKFWIGLDVLLRPHRTWNCPCTIYSWYHSPRSSGTVSLSTIHIYIYILAQDISRRMVRSNREQFYVQKQLDQTQTPIPSTFLLHPYQNILGNPNRTYLSFSLEYRWKPWKNSTCANLFVDYSETNQAEITRHCPRAT